VRSRPIQTNFGASRPPVDWPLQWPRVALVAALALGVSGCGETVSFSVLRAARVNVKGMAGNKDATVSVGEWGGVDQAAAADVKQRIVELVTNAEGGVVKFSTTRGVVHVDGQVSEHGYTENVTSTQSQCSRYNSQTKKSESYSCTHRKRVGVAHVRIAANVVDESGKVVASDSFSEKAEQGTSATDGDPDSIDGQQLLASLRAQGAAKLAALVVPHRVQVTKKWFKCGDASAQCDAGLLHLRSGNFAPAREQFTKAVDLLRGQAKPDAEAIAAAWWGITLSHEFDGNFAGARVALEEAIKLDPKNETYAGEGRLISEEEQNAQKLGKQGVGGD